MNFIEANRRKTHCLNGHEFTPENTYLYKGSRHCVACRKRRDKTVTPEQRAARKIRQDKWNPGRRRYINFKSHLKKYNLTVDQYNELVVVQNGKCPICQDSLFLSLSRRPHVDHDHRTGKVRGILCGNCNTALGGFKDDHRILSNAQLYILKHHLPDLPTPYLTIPTARKL